VEILCAYSKGSSKTIQTRSKIKGELVMIQIVATMKMMKSISGGNHNKRSKDE